MRFVSDLMTKQVFTLRASDSLQDAEQLMGEKKIRHIPIIDDLGRVVGLLSQREVLTEAFRIIDKFGAQNLRSYLAKTPIENSMNTNFTPFAGNLTIKEAAETLLRQRLGCMVIVNEAQELLGIVSSQDFVRLSIDLL